MRVAIFGETRLWGGLEVHAVALAEWLADQGHTVSLVCLGPETRRVYEARPPRRTALIEVAPPARRSVRAWWRALQNITADAVVLEKGTLWTGGLALDSVLRLKFGRYVAIQQLEPPDLPARQSRRHLAGLLPGVGLWWYRWKWAGWARSLAPRWTVCVSDAVRESLASQYGFSQRRLITIRNGVDLEVFRPDGAVRAEVRREWNMPEDAFTFGVVSRLVRHKGVDVAIEALRRVVEAVPNRPVYLVIAGEGVERPALEALASARHLADRVRFLGLVRSPPRVYQALDVYLMPSRSEALGIALIEAMASGCQVIASDVGGIPEIVSDPSIGTLVPPADVDALAAAMTAALQQDEPRRAAVAAAAREHIAQRFDVRAQCSRIAALLT
jgi:glycosyltransferase involved in cell wall biosynthesis